MKNTVNNNVKTKSTFSNFLKVEIAKKQLKSVKGGADNDPIIFDDLLDG